MYNQQDTLKIHGYIWHCHGTEPCLMKNFRQIISSYAFTSIMKPIGETFLPTFLQNTKTHYQVAVLNAMNVVANKTSLLPLKLPCPQHLLSNEMKGRQVKAKGACRWSIHQKMMIKPQIKKFSINPSFI